MAIKKIKYIHVVSKDLEASRNFYKNLLGLPEHSVTEGTAYGPSDHVQLWPMSVDDTEGAAQPGQTIVAMSSDDVQGDYDRLTKAGVKFLVPPSSPYGKMEAHLQDPDGLWIILIEE